MNKRTATAAFLVGLIWAGTASAEQPNVMLQGFGAVQAQSSAAGGTSTDGSQVGGGLNVIVPITGWVGLRGQIQSLSGDQGPSTARVDTSQEEVRFAAEFGIPMGRARLTISPEFLNTRTETGNTSESAPGGALHLGLRTDHGGRLNGYARGGFVSIDDLGKTQGVEINAGISGVIGAGVGLFSEYRMQKFENDNNNKLDAGLFRLGLHVQF